MAKSLVQPEHLTDLVSSDAQTESGRLDRWIRGDNMTEALRVLELDEERKELFDIHIEHVTVFFDDALMHKLALKIDPNATRDLEGNFESLATASVSANKSYNVFFNKIKTRNIQNLNPIRLLISSPGGFMDFGVFFNGAAATFD